MPADAAGPRVYQCLMRKLLPADIEVTDGGLHGLELLPLIEDSRRVVFVDSVSGFREKGGIVILEAADIASTAGKAYDHAAGVAYLVRVLPHVCKAGVPEIALVGIEGEPEEEAIEEAADLAVRLTLGESPPAAYVL